jgi:predicted nucleic acid-binding protein
MPDEQTGVCYVDTNVWLYAFVESDEVGKTETARSLIRSVQPVVSTQVINEVCVNLLKRARFAEDQINQLIESFYAVCGVVGLDRPVLLAASQLRQRYSLSFWDSMIVSAALSVGAQVLYSEDLQHNLSIGGQLRVLNPFAST